MLICIPTVLLIAFVLLTVTMIVTAVALCAARKTSVSNQSQREQNSNILKRMLRILFRDFPLIQV